jgi:hypothetical protein
MATLPFARSFALLLPSAVALVAAPAFAGGSPENALLIVDPTNAESLYVANYYKHVRDIPDANVIYMSPNPGAYSQFVASTLDGFQGTLDNLRVSDHIDYVILPSGSSFYMDAPGLISDMCAPVTRFSATSPYALAFIKSLILAGNNGSQLPNGYYGTNDQAIAFDSQSTWANGIAQPGGTRYYIAAMLGYTGSLGNTTAEVIAMIDRSVAIDGARPAGTYYFMHTSDPVRSGPRDPFYPAAVSSITAQGGSASLLFADLPLGQFDCLGIMTGLADPQIDTANMGILPGAFCDHLTSFAAAYDINSQTKMSRWIAKGASGSSGAIEEPCNYAGKFPHARLHVYYHQGVSLGEAWFRSLGFAPFQVLFTGDPLTRPFAYIPSVSVSGIPPSPASGLVVLMPSATTAHPTAHIASFDLLVDGHLVAQTTPGHGFPLDTTALADGWHDLRVLAHDDTPVKSTGRLSGTLQVNNHNRSASVSASTTSGDLDQRFDFTIAGAGGSVTALDLIHNSRVVASAAGASASVSVYGRTFGAGAVRVELEARFSDGTSARSTPVDLSIANTTSSPGGSLLAYNYVKHIRNDRACVVELPALVDDPTAAWVVLSPPLQSGITGTTPGPYRILEPNAAASGTDALTFRVNAAAGQSNVATVTIVYDPPPTCPTPTNYCTSTPNSSGAAAIMSWGGSASIGANDLELQAFFLPPNKVGIFIVGASAQQSPLANGFLCVGAPFSRLGVVQSDFFGGVSQTLDFTQPPFATTPGLVATGSSAKFQLWYRDPAAGGGFSNLTDGLSVTFCP